VAQTDKAELFQEGLEIHTTLDMRLQRAAEEIRRFLSECQESEELIRMAAHHEGAFCYFQDYLIKRLEPWRVLDFVQNFILSWQNAYERVKDNIENLYNPYTCAIHHPASSCSSCFLP
jgi:hypothetical protein